MSYLSPTLNLLISVVKKAGHGLTRDFNEIEKLQNSVKGSQEFVASAYSRCEKYLRQELNKAKPQYPFAEEGKPEPQGAYFVITPLDGIVNFANAVPFFSISAAIVENGIPLMSVVYNPVADEMYFAEKGRGAYREGFRNHERLRVSAKKDLKNALLSVSPSFHKEQSEFLRLYANVAAACDNVRILGSSALEMAYVAAGRLDASIGLNISRLSIVSGYLIVKEAGGAIRGLNQKDIRAENLAEVLSEGNAFASNSNISAIIYNELKK